MSKNTLIEAINASIPFDLVIKNVKLVNVITREIYDSEIGIKNGRIGHVNQPGEEPLEAKEYFDAKGGYAIPGLIDTHIHTESTMMTLKNVAEALLTRGTTTIACDPHEIANVMGIDGVKYIMESAKDTPLLAWVMAPSCVPSIIGPETSGALFERKEIKQMLELDEVLGLGEVMDYTGVINQSQRVSDILDEAKKHNALIQGHCPMLTGRSLSAYMSTGVKSCHESSFAEEARYKLRAGMVLECRESSVVHDMKELAGVIKEYNYPENATLCTDDREPDDLYQQGHIDHVIRVAIDAGIPPIEAIKMATLNAAKLLGIDEIGSLTPGKLANVVILENLDEITVSDVFVKGDHVASQGKLIQEIEAKEYPLEKLNTVILKQEPALEDFKIKCDKEKAAINVIAYDKKVPIITRLEQAEVPTKNGYIDITNEKDLCILSVFERHGVNGNKSSCIIKDIGLTKGAIASTVAHDCHNLLVLGKSESDMLMAANVLKEKGGGIVCVVDGKVEAIVELPIAGLLSKKPVNELAEKTALLKQKMGELGISGDCMLLPIVFLALPVIPEARLTDYGLIDVANNKVIPVVIE